MIENRFKTTDGIIIGAYLTSSKKNAIFAQGFPHYVTRESPIINTLTQLGWNVFVPRYTGSWESRGTFTLRNAIETIQKTMTFVRNGSGKELYDGKPLTWETERTVLIGFSFGGLVSAHNWNNADKTILIAPLINYQLHKKTGGEDIEKTITFVQEAYGSAYRFKKKELLNEFASLVLPDAPKKNVVILQGEKDTEITKEEFRWAHEQYRIPLHTIPTGHTSNVPIAALQEELQ